MTIKKYLLSGVILVLFAFYTVALRPKTPTEQVGTSASTPAVTETPTSSSSDQSSSIPSSQDSPAASSPPPTTTTPSSSNTAYKDGTYTSPSTDAFYGNVQIKVTVAKGKITNLAFLDYPQDRANSVRINSVATPILKSETIAAQSANVDVVSGATATSEAFIQALTDVLQQARA